MLEKYKLGIEIIDNQHKRIFEIIEKLCDQECDDCMSEIIQELKDYAKYHFDTEETYFKNIGYIGADEHINLHNIFTQTISYYSDTNSKLNKKKIYTFLQSWIKNHILIEDKKYTLKENLI